LFQSSEIYGGLNGFWDYGPLGVELKRNIKGSLGGVIWSPGHNELVERAGSARRRMKWLGSMRTIIMHPAGVEVLGTLRSVLRHDGRLPADEAIATDSTQLRGTMGRVSGPEGIRHRALAENEAEDIAQRCAETLQSACEGTRIRSLGMARSMSLAKVDDLEQGAGNPKRNEPGTLHRARAPNST